MNTSENILYKRWGSVVWAVGVGDKKRPLDVKLCVHCSIKLPASCWWYAIPRKLSNVFPSRGYCGHYPNQDCRNVPYRGWNTGQRGCKYRHPLAINTSWSILEYSTYSLDISFSHIQIHQGIRYFLMNVWWRGESSVNFSGRCKFDFTCIRGIFSLFNTLRIE